MRRANLFLLALMMTLLAGCASPEETKDEFNAWRQTIENVDCTALVTLSQGKLAAAYELKCSYTPETCTVEILAPERIRGVTASRGGGQTRLEYDGLILDLGEQDSVSPISALPALIELLRTGYVDRVAEEPDGKTALLAVQFAPVENTVVRLWLKNDHTPVRADFVGTDGLAGIKIEITDWNVD